MNLLKLTEKETLKRIDALDSWDNIGKLYFDLFGEYPLSSASWDAGYPLQEVFSAICLRKPMKPDKRLEDTYIKF